MRRALAAVALVALTTGCAGGERIAGPSDDGRLRVVASFYPLFEAAQRVGGDRAAVTNLTAAGSEPHDLELNSRQVDRIEDASVVFFLGRGFQPAVEKALARAQGQRVDVLAQVGDLLPAPAGDDHLQADPHVWLDPAIYRAVVRNVAAVLSSADPANRAVYEANAAAYDRDLADLDAAYTQGLAHCDRRSLVTSHAAFGYLARRYGLVQEAIAGIEPDAEPNARRLAELAAKVRADGTTTIFSETLASPKVAQALAREAGVRTAVLDPLEGLSDDDLKAGKDYVSVMRENLAALRQGLGCR